MSLSRGFSNNFLRLRYYPSIFFHPNDWKSIILLLRLNALLNRDEFHVIPPVVQEAPRKNLATHPCLRHSNGISRSSITLRVKPALRMTLTVKYRAPGNWFLSISNSGVLRPIDRVLQLSALSGLTWIR